MKVKLRNAVTREDIDELRAVYDRLQVLMREMNPSASCHAPLYAAIATVRQCARDWSGDPFVWERQVTPSSAPSGFGVDRR